MKPTNLLAYLTACALIVAATSSSPAQTGNSGAQKPARAAQRQPAGARLAPALGPIANVLTEEQRASLQKNMAGQREKIRGIQTQLAQSRRDLLAASVSGTFDEKTVRPKAMAVARLEAQMAVLRARALAQIQPPLSAEQIEKIMNSAPAVGRVGPRALNRGISNGERRRPSANTTRDENGLPPK